MASSCSEDHLCCSVCKDIFKHPVVLSCSHSFCKACLQSWWEEKQVQECPICKQPSKNDPPCNLVLKNLCEAFLLQRAQRASSNSEDQCSLHSEKLRLFCLDHQQPACLICKDSENHTNHRFRPMDEAAQDLRYELQESLKPLKDKLRKLNEIKKNWDVTGGHIKSQAADTERHIKEQFKKLHQFLSKEEEARICAVRKEEEQKSQSLKEKMEALSTEIAALSETVRATEEQLTAADVSFLKNYKAAVEKVQQRPLLEDPQLPEGALIHVTKHLGNLSFNIWTKMKDLVSCLPVILDPNTAGSAFFVYDGLNFVGGVWRQQMPDNPERVYDYFSVLGSEGFNSGTHSWDVEVGDNRSWAVGVCEESADRKRNMKSGLWMIGRYEPEFSRYEWNEGDDVDEGDEGDEGDEDDDDEGDEGDEGDDDDDEGDDDDDDDDDDDEDGDDDEDDNDDDDDIHGIYKAYNPSGEHTVLSVSRPPEKIRVDLDWDRGRLSFSDPDSNTPLHTFTHTFTQKLFPYVWTDGRCLKILTVEISVSVE